MCVTSGCQPVVAGWVSKLAVKNIIECHFIPSFIGVAYNQTISELTVWSQLSMIYLLSITSRFVVFLFNFKFVIMEIPLNLMKMNQPE